MESELERLRTELATERQRAEAAKALASGIPQLDAWRNDTESRLAASEAKRKALREAMCSIWSIGQECKGPDSAEEQRMFDIACEALTADSKEAP